MSEKTDANAVHITSAVTRRAAHCVIAAEQVVLPEIVVALFPRAMLARRVNRCEQLRSHVT